MVDRGDPGLFYHITSSISEGYYGWSVRVPHGYPEYYKEYPNTVIVELPPPIVESGIDAFTVLRGRRSRRSFLEKPLTLKEVSTILFYTLGITGRTWWGGPKRTYPSAGALQPVEAYIIANNVLNLASGVYHYNPGRHCLELISKGDYAGKLYHASLQQEHVREAPVIIILTVYYPRTASQYHVRAYRYVLLDAGFAGENLYLAAEALGLATVAVGAFIDQDICSILRIDCDWEYPLLIFPIGWRID